MNQTIKNIGIRYGVLLAIILVIINLFIYFYDYTLMNSIINGFGLIFLILIFGIISMVTSKKKIGGYITFREAFTPYILVITIGVLVPTLLQFLIYGVFDTATGEALKQHYIALTAEQLNKFNVPAEQAQVSIEAVKASNPYAIGTLLTSGAIRIAMLSVVGLIAALIFRNKTEFSAKPQA